MKDPESTTNSLSLGLIDDDAGRHHTSEGEKNVYSIFAQVTFDWYNFLARSQGSLRAHRSFLTVSSLVRSSNFWSKETALVRMRGLNHTE